MEPGMHLRSRTMTGPPLDWHADGDFPIGELVLCDPSTTPSAPLDVLCQIIESMCPREVCGTCGQPRERITEQSPEYRAARAEVRAETAGTITEQNTLTRGRGFGNGSGAASLINNRKVSAAPITLGWSDCGHDSWRPGIVLDPFDNPAIAEAARLAGRDYRGSA